MGLFDKFKKEAPTASYKRVEPNKAPTVKEFRASGFNYFMTKGGKYNIEKYLERSYAEKNPKPATQNFKYKEATLPATVVFTKDKSPIICVNGTKVCFLSYDNIKEFTSTVKKAKAIYLEVYGGEYFSYGLKETVKDAVYTKATFKGTVKVQL